MPKAVFDKIVIITRKTAQEELIERFSSESQARFYLERLGGSFDDYADAHHTFHQSLKLLNQSLPEVRCQHIDRSFLPNFLFGPKDLVVVLGQDGLVVNTAKYLDGQPLVGINPDPTRFDGILLPFEAGHAKAVLRDAAVGNYSTHDLTMAQASLNNGQSLYAVNDLFIGFATHASARYRIAHRQQEENQSSSGIIVSTGAGSTGWSRSILTGASAVIEGFERRNKPFQKAREEYRFDYRSEWLRFHVREPFVSRTSEASIILGTIDSQSPLTVTSRMPSGGVIFGDGVEQDFLTFDSGTTATITIADRKLRLVAP